MPNVDRRNRMTALGRGKEKELNEAQKDTLRQLEAVGWELKFVRRPLFQPSIPVVFDGARKRYAVLEPDGTLNENPGFDIRT